VGPFIRSTCWFTNSMSWVLPYESPVSPPFSSSRTEDTS
jgi:hypothetical protein